MRTSDLALVLSGVFVGGAIDHAALAMLGRRTTPYGIRTGRVGNLMFAALDMALAGLFLRLHRRAAGA